MKSYSKTDLQAMLDRVGLRDLFPDEESLMSWHELPIYAVTCPFCEGVLLFDDEHVEKPFHCFDCNFTGSHISLVMCMHEFSYDRAVEYLAEIADYYPYEIRTLSKLLENAQMGLSDEVVGEIKELFKRKK